MERTYGWIGDGAILHGDIKVDTNENTFSSEIEVSDG
jgi:hypothetical protein